MIVSVLDPSIAITVLKRTPLLYAAGANIAEDRPAYARAASGICRWGDHLIVIQDDANWFASIDESGCVFPIALPRGRGGLRLFDDIRGNKADKLDLETCTVVTAGDRRALLAFGSGSTLQREQVVMLNAQGLRIVTAHALYQSLRDAKEFSGSELNVEGVVAFDKEVVLFNRGNGLGAAVNATCNLNAEELLHYLDDPTLRPPPLAEVRMYDLGCLGDTRLTFTDGAMFDGQLVYVAAAEASPDAVQDGPVAGVAIGVLGERPRYGIVRDASGADVCAKIEGLFHDRGRWLAVVDSDDSARPAELLELHISGF